MADSEVPNGTETYNYESFSRSSSDDRQLEIPSLFAGPERILEFIGLAGEGNWLRLSHLRGAKHVLLEFGRIT